MRPGNNSGRRQTGFTCCAVNGRPPGRRWILGEGLRVEGPGRPPCWRTHTRSVSRSRGTVAASISGGAEAKPYVSHLTDTTDPLRKANLLVRLRFSTHNLVENQIRPLTDQELQAPAAPKSWLRHCFSHCHPCHPRTAPRTPTKKKPNS